MIIYNFYITYTCSYSNSLWKLCYDETQEYIFFRSVHISQIIYYFSGCVLSFMSHNIQLDLYYINN